MDLNEFAQEVHANAVEHGWWGKEYTCDAAISLIHTEISEALESWRNKEPMVWHACKAEREVVPCESLPMCVNKEGNRIRVKGKRKDRDVCNYRGTEPEGIAVELVDAVLRILDAAAAWEFDIPSIEAYDLRYVFVNSHRTPAKDVDLPSLVAELHCNAANAWMELTSGEREDGMDWLLMTALPNIYAWLRAQNIDPEPIMLEKHEYNKSRPYKHGGKRI